MQFYKKKKIAAHLFLAIMIIFSISGTAHRPFAPAEQTATAAENSELTIRELKTGDRVMDPTWEWEHKTGVNYTGTGQTKPVTWIVASSRQYGFRSGVTLISEEIIGLFPFDNSTDQGSPTGSNNWGKSGGGNATMGLRPWLNSTGIHSDEGFYNSFSVFFQDALVNTSVPNKDWQSGDEYTTRDKVFIPSTTELGDSHHHWTYETGSTFSYFLSDYYDKRKAEFNGEANYYWTRSPHSGAEYGGYLRGISPNGNLGSYARANLEVQGVRPVVNISFDTPVSATPDSNNVYIIEWDTGERDALVSPEKAFYAIDLSGSLSVTLFPHNRTLERISDGGKDLKQGTHYTVSGHTYTFLSSYIDSKGPGTLTLTFHMDGGKNPYTVVEVINREDNIQTISDIRIGDRVIHDTWNWEHRTGNNYAYNDFDSYNPITWIVVAKDHYAGSPGVTLLSESLIGKYYFDNSTDIHEWGSNHWGKSGGGDASMGLRPWLNTTFYSAFSDQFRDLLVETVLPCLENNSYFSGEEYHTRDKVFLPSEKEINAVDNYAHKDEAVWPYFADSKAKDRAALLEGISTPYWTRSPYIDNDHLLRYVHSTGFMQYGSAHNIHRGVRPALNINPDAPVSVIPGSDGVFRFLTPSPKYSTVEPAHSKTITPGQIKGIILTLKDQYSNPFSISDRKTVTMEQRNGNPVTDFDWIKSVTYDYSYGDSNQVLISIEADEFKKGHSANTFVRYYNLSFRYMLETSYAGFNIQHPGAQDAGEPFSLQITGATDYEGYDLDGEYHVTVTSNRSADGVVYDSGETNFKTGRAGIEITLQEAGTHHLTVNIAETGSTVTVRSVNIASQTADAAEPTPPPPAGAGATVSPEQDSYVMASGRNIIITFNSNGDNLKRIRNTDEDNYYYELVKNKDYTAEGNVYTILPDYLDSKSIGTITLTFETDGSNSPEVTLNVTPRPGDISGSGDITVSDAILALRHIVGLTNLEDQELYFEGALDRARVGGAKTLTVSDAILILRYIVGLTDLNLVTIQG